MNRRALLPLPASLRFASIAPLAAVAAAVSFAASWLVHEHVDVAHRWFAAGDMLQTNTFSGLTLSSFDATLGHVQLALAGGAVIAVVLAAIAARREPIGPRLRAAARFVTRRPEIAILALLAVVLVQVAAKRSFDGPGGRVYFLEDDAMISMRYAKNLARGAGLVFNPGERVEGFTNPLWVLVMAAVHLAGPPERLAALYVLLLTTGLTAWIVVLQASILRRLHAGPLWIAACAVATIFDENVITWMASGLEPIALAALLTTCVWAIARRRWTAAYAVLCLVPLIRADGFVPAAAVGLLLLAEDPKKKRAVLGLALSIVPLLALVAFRMAYYGHPLPNTYYLKMIGFGDRLAIGVGGYGARLVMRYPVVLLLAFGGAFVRRAPRVLRGAAGLVALQCAYSIYVGGDTFWCLRFVTPVIPLAYVAAAFAGAEVVRGLGPARRAMAACAVIAMAPAYAPDGQLGTPREVSGFANQSLALAEMIRRNVPPGKSLTVYPAGTVPYFAMDYRFIDVLGKNDEHIAHLDHYRGKLIGHNKFDFDYVYSRKPDLAFIFDRCAHVDEVALMTAEERRRIWDSLDDFAFVANFSDISNPAFLADYYPYRVHFVGAPAPPPMECTFVRKGGGLSTFWTPDGPLPAADGVTIRLGEDPQPGAAIGARWSAPRDVPWGDRARRAEDGAEAQLETWLTPGAKRIDVCTARVEGAKLAIRVNGVPVETAPAPAPPPAPPSASAAPSPPPPTAPSPPAPSPAVPPSTPPSARPEAAFTCGGEIRVGTIEADAIARDPQLTRIGLTPDTGGRGLDVAWVRVQPAP